MNLLSKEDARTGAGVTGLLFVGGLVVIGGSIVDHLMGQFAVWPGDQSDTGFTVGVAAGTVVFVAICWVLRQVWQATSQRLDTELDTGRLGAAIDRHNTRRAPAKTARQAAHVEQRRADHEADLAARAVELAYARSDDANAMRDRLIAAGLTWIEADNMVSLEAKRRQAKHDGTTIPAPVASHLNHSWKMRDLERRAERAGIVVSGSYDTLDPSWKWQAQARELNKLS